MVRSIGIIGNTRKTDTNKELSFEIFKVWFEGYSKYVKEFDISKDKNALMDEVLERVLSGEFGTLKEFAESAFKSFYLENKADSSRFIGLKTNNIAINTTFAINELFDNKLGISIGVKTLSHEECYKTMAKIFVDELEKRGDKYLYVDKMTSCARSKFFHYVLHEFANRGVDTSNLDRKRFLTLTNKSNKEMSNSQDFYLNQYLKILEDIVRNYVGIRSVLFQYEKSADVQKFWTVVDEHLRFLEGRLTEKTKQDKRFLAAKKEINIFFNETLKILCQKRTREGKFGIYCAEIQEIVKKLKKGEISAEEGKVLMNFLINTKDVNEAMKITDKNGKNYPLNYFVVMPIAPDAYTRILADLVKIGKFNESTLKFLDETKLLVRKAFFMGVHSFSDTPEDLEVVFKPCKCTIERNGKRLDTSSDEGFEKALNLGRAYIEKYNLPKSKLCYTALAREIFTVDRREPVCLTERLESKFLKEKTI